jgi:sirohydrochlorin ferrochelatase
MRDEVRRGVLVVGHGSRRREANDDVREAAERIAERGRFPLVEAAFLEIEHPNISRAFARLVERGADEIIVHPYFLSPGRHTRGDIPIEVREAASHHPGANYRITEPLSAHPLVIEASVERLFETVDRDRDGKASNAGVYRARCGRSISSAQDRVIRGC